MANARRPIEATQAAQLRLDVLAPLPLLELKAEAVTLARALVTGGAVPEEAVEDALHIAVATTHGMDYLLTWNCRHIANATTRNAITTICRSLGYEAPVICTPEELMGE
jgi:hypothetical protein